MKDYHAIADRWVSEFVDRHVKTRILDGRPDRVLIKTLTNEVAQLLTDQCSVEPNEVAKPKKKGAAS